MSEAQEAKQRDVEQEEPLQSQLIFKGPQWLRRLFMKTDSSNGSE